MKTKFEATLQITQDSFIFFLSVEILNTSQIILDSAFALQKAVDIMNQQLLLRH